MIPVAAKPLDTLDEIKREFRVGRAKVLLWVQAGAPIAVHRDRKGRILGYSSEYNTLFAWRVQFERGQVA